MKYKTKILAIIAVFAMLAVCFVPIDNESDATDGVLESLQSGSWTWDRTTGLGPFNSFYAAFDMTNGNAFYAVLDPYDLTKTVGGDSLSPMSNYNIMWVLPTVYWKSVGNTLTLTNDSTAGGTAYAHTIDGHVYNYIAIGVYHGAKKTVGGVDVLTSESGVAPTASQTKAVFRDQANNYVMDSSLGSDAHSMLWNFDMWTLYKLCCWTVMEDFNSQATVGNGNVNGGNYTKVSGSLDTYGPYAGNNGDLGSSGSGATTYGHDAAKLFIEEPWGTVRDFVDGVMVNANQGFYIDSSSIPTDSTTAGGNVTYVACALPSSGWQSAISTDARTFGIGTATTGAWNTGLADYIYTATSGSKVLYVGGHSYTDASNSVDYGLSSAGASSGTSNSAPNLGSRLALVFDAGPAAMGGSSYSYGLVYDPTAMATTSAALSVAGMDPITHDAPQAYTATIESNNTSYGTVDQSTITDIAPGTAVTITNNGKTLTIGSAGTVTATPVTSTAQYTYGFTGWYDGTKYLQTGDTIDADVTITATFTQTLNDYIVTIARNNTNWGTVSESSVTVPYGTSISAASNVLTIGSNNITATAASATAQYSYAFVNWTGASGTVTENKTITANFERTVNQYTVSVTEVDPANIGSFNVMSYAADYGTSVTFTDSSILFGGVARITETHSGSDAQYTNTFAWSPNLPFTLTQNVQVTGTFTQTVNDYVVTIAKNHDDWGTVSLASVTVPYGTEISAASNVLSIGSTDITATPAEATAQYTFSFGDWTNGTGTVQGATTVTANFTATTNEYTVTIESGDVQKGTVSPTTVSNVPYGTEITVSGDTITIGSTEVTATAAQGYELASWSVRSGDKVTGDLTITATFDEPKDVNNILLKLIPLILIIALVVLAATAMFSFNGDGQQLIRFIIVLGISVVLITTVLIPAVGGI